MKVCRVCLSTDSKLYDMKQYNLDEPYEKITGINVTGVKYPDMLCVECAQRLLNCIRFRGKCIQAHTLLTEIWDTYGGLTAQSVNSVDRHQNGLVSQLQVKHIEADHCDLYCEHADTHREELAVSGSSEMKNDETFLVKIEREFDYESIVETKIEMNEDNHHFGFVEVEINPNVELTNKVEKPDDVDMAIAENSDTVDTVKSQTIDWSVEDSDLQDSLENLGSDLDSDSDSSISSLEASIIEKEVSLDTYACIGTRCALLPPIINLNCDKSVIKAIEKKHRTIRQGALQENRRSGTQSYCRREKPSYIQSTPTNVSRAMRIIEKWSKPKGRKCVSKSEKSVTKSGKSVSKSVKSEKKSKKTKAPVDDDLKAHFTITIVTVEEQKQEILKRKESTTYQQSKFKCTECFKGFVDETAYNNHMVRHTKKCGEFQCEICKTHFKLLRYLKKHMACSHSRRYKCKECTFVTLDSGNAKRHVLFHKGVKYKCDECQLEFNTMSGHLSHKRIKHSSDFVCQLCGYSFLSEKGVYFHKNSQHKLDKGEITSDSPLCETCNIRFYSVDALRTHMAVSDKHKNHDTGDGDRRVRIVRQKRSHTKRNMKPNEGPIPCEQCGEVLDSPREYFYHFKRTHPGVTRTVYFNSMKQMFMCEQCGMMLQSECALRDHMYAHTGEKRFKCDKCKKAFTFKNNLQSHMKIHLENQLMYECPTCGMKFTHRSNMNRHMKIHTGIKAFKCSVCEKSFLSSYERYTHHKYVHLKEPWPKRSHRRRKVPHTMEDYGE